MGVVNVTVDVPEHVTRSVRICPFVATRLHILSWAWIPGGLPCGPDCPGGHWQSSPMAGAVGVSMGLADVTFRYPDSIGLAVSGRRAHGSDCRAAAHIRLVRTARHRVTANIVILALTAMIMVAEGVWSPTAGLLAITGIAAVCLVAQLTPVRQRGDLMAKEVQRHVVRTGDLVPNRYAPISAHVSDRYQWSFREICTSCSNGQRLST